MIYNYTQKNKMCYTKIDVHRNKNEDSMATFKDMEDSLKNYIIQEQSDAHNIRSVNVAQYNNIKINMDPAKNQMPHITVRISISEATYSLNDFSKLNGGLGYEERLVLKWFGRYGIKDKLTELWATAEKSKDDEE